MTDLLLTSTTAVHDYFTCFNSHLELEQLCVQVRIPEDPEELVYLWVSVEQRLLGGEFSKDRPSAPNINRGWISGWTQEDLWSSVPKSNNLKTNTHRGSFSALVSLEAFLCRFTRVLMILSLWSLCCVNRFSPRVCRPWQEHQRPEPNQNQPV